VIFSTTGHKILTALYNGDSIYSSSTATEGHDVVTTANLSITNITADTPDPSVPGQVVDVEVTVTGTGTYPTGTVAITGADTNCTVTLGFDGHGTCNVIYNTVGPKTLKAVYSGNANYSSSSDTETHTVSTGLAATATSITSNVPNPSTPGQAVVVSVTVSGAGLPVPTGTVDITGADTNCSILLAGGSGSCSVTFNSAGHKTITAQYNGDVKYAPSSDSAGQIVDKGSTTTTIISLDPEPSMPTQPVEVEFSVVGAGVTPTGIVSITGADINCSITLSGGNGSCNIIFNTIGVNKPVTASYSGDANYLPSTAGALHTVKNATTTVIISDVNDPSVPGEAVMVTVKVTGTGAASPMGTVNITGADVNCPAGLAPSGVGESQGSCPVTFNTAGAKVLTATYDATGDPNYVGSLGTASHNVNKGTTTTVTAPGAAVINAPVTVSVTVNPVAPGVLAPTGTVAIATSDPLSTSCTVTLVAGSGSCVITFKTVGPFTLTATYSGDGNYLGSFLSVPYTIT
jgi:hypothetical protein